MNGFWRKSNGILEKQQNSASHNSWELIIIIIIIPQHAKIYLPTFLFLHRKEIKWVPKTKLLFIFHFSVLCSFPVITSHFCSFLLWLTVLLILRLPSPSSPLLPLSFAWIPAHHVGGCVSVHAILFLPHWEGGCDRQLPLTIWLESWNLAIDCRNLPLVLCHPSRNTANPDNSTNSQIFLT